MKQLITSIVLSFLCMHLSLPRIHAQFQSIDAILNLPEQNAPVYDTSACSTCIYLQIEYGSSELLNLDILKRFEGRKIESVLMVYTAFSRSKVFDQATLNRERLLELQDIAPELFEPAIEWGQLRQTQAHSFEESIRLFHGFVVKLPAGSTQRDEEGKLAPAKTVEKEKKKPALVWKDSLIERRYVKTTKTVKRDCEKTGKYLPRNADKRRQGIRHDQAKAGLFFKRKPEKRCTTLVSYKRDTIVRKIIVQINPITGKPRDGSLMVSREDTTVLEVMTRNWEEWKDAPAAMVVDVTASMYNYLDQMITWQENYSQKGVEHFVFFNDGDDKPESKKVIGKTGGIYYVQSKNINDLQETAERAMKAGEGGDLPENNVEAILAAQDRCRDCDQVVMIADNYAPVKDLKLLSKVKVPVHIIVCGGTGEWVHPDYMTIAARTKGSVHTASIDLDMRNALEKNEPIRLGNREYRFDTASKRYRWIKTD